MTEALEIQKVSGDPSDRKLCSPVAGKLPDITEEKLKLLLTATLLDLDFFDSYFNRSEKQKDTRFDLELVRSLPSSLSNHTFILHPLPGFNSFRVTSVPMRKAAGGKIWRLLFPRGAELTAPKAAVLSQSVGTAWPVAQLTLLMCLATMPHPLRDHV